MIGFLTSSPTTRLYRRRDGDDDDGDDDDDDEDDGVNIAAVHFTNNFCKLKIFEAMLTTVLDIPCL